MPRTRAWIAKSIAAHVAAAGEGAVTCAARLVGKDPTAIGAAMADAVVRLIVETTERLDSAAAGEAHMLPETLAMDGSSLAQARDACDRLALCASVVMLVRQCLATRRRVALPADAATKLANPNGTANDRSEKRIASGSSCIVVMIPAILAMATAARGPRKILNAMIRIIAAPNPTKPRTKPATNTAASDIANVGPEIGPRIAAKTSIMCPLK